MGIENNSDAFTQANTNKDFRDHFSISERFCLTARDVMNTKVVVISPDETVAAASVIMAGENISCIVVTDNEKVIGIFTERDLLKKIVAAQRNAAAVRIRDAMSFPVVRIPPGILVLEASKIMHEKHIKRLPVMEKERLIGIITQTDMIRALTSTGLWRCVEDIMSRNVAVFAENKTVAEAAKVMASRNISCVVVLDKDEAVGVVTERDLIAKIAAAQKDPSRTKIKEVMSSPVKIIPSDYSAFHVNRLMQQMNVRRLVVMKDKKLCGIITQTDLFYEAKRVMQAEEEEGLKLLGKSDNGIFAIDLDGKITYVNRAMIRLLEVPKAEALINQPFLPEKFLFRPKDGFRLLRELIVGGGLAVKDLTLRTEKGREISVILFGAFTKNSHGEINGARGVFYVPKDKKG